MFNCKFWVAEFHQSFSKIIFGYCISPGHPDGMTKECIAVLPIVSLAIGNPPIAKDQTNDNNPNNWTRNSEFNAVGRSKPSCEDKDS